MNPNRARAVCYRGLLRLYPRAFRQAYGAEMERTFVRMLTQAKASRGMTGACTVWLGALWDVARSALRERLAATLTERGGVVRGFRADLRQAMRALTARPAFAATVIFVLALGIGANSAIFSLVNAALLRPLPYRDPDRLVLLWQTWKALDLDQVPVTRHDFIDIRDRATQLSHVALFRSGSRVLSGQEPRRLRALVVSPDLFPLLGVDPLLGRAFRPDEELPPNRDRVILTHRAWREVFGGDSRIVGTSVVLDDRPHTIVGVMPAGFTFPPPVTYAGQMLAIEPDVFVPFALFPEPRDGNHSHFVVARLAAGATQASTDAELGTIHAQLAATYPANEGVGAYTLPLDVQSVETLRTSMLVLLGAVACVLLMACTGVANLMTSRGVARRREFSVRTALGASRWRLVRQVLLESTALGLLSGALGLLLAQWLVDGASRLNPMNVPDIFAARLDWRVLAFTAAISLATSVTFGLLPALQVSRSDPASVFRGGARTAGSRSETRLKNLLVVGQTAIAVLLLVLAGLALRSFRSLWNVDAGFDARPLVSFQVALPESRYPSPADQYGFATRLLEELEAVPNIESAAASTRLPFVFDQNSTNYVIDGEASPRQGAQVVDRTLVTPSYFETMGARLIWGRALSAADTGAVRVGIVNETLARRHWPAGDWTGRRLAFDSVPDDDAGWITIVGVIDDIRSADLTTVPEPMIYLPLVEGPPSSFFVLARTTGDPEASIAPARAVLRRLDPTIPMDGARLMDARRAESVKKPRFLALLLGGFGLLALMVATVGLYSTLAFDTSRRTREFGIRMALGARPGAVLSLVASHGLRLTAAGIALGLSASVAVSPALDGLLYGVPSTDVSSFAAAGATLLTAATLATWLPAHRAARIDPADALRAE